MNPNRFSPFNRVAALLFAIAFLAACGGEKITQLPDPATSSKQVEAFVKRKKFDVVKVGYYGALTVNDKTEMEWIDTTVSNDRTTLDVMNELDKWEMHFGNDTAATIISKGKPFAATWLVDDKEDADMNEPKAIRIRTTYVDPEMSFGGSSPMAITYSYVVKGINENELLVELPREINRRKLVALMKSK